MDLWYSAAILPIVIMFISWFISYRAAYMREKPSPFECGFDPLKSARLPFSLHFFLLTIIFLIFDVEIVLLFPVLLSINMFYTFVVGAGVFVFLIILILGLLYEWTAGSLSWM